MRQADFNPWIFFKLVLENQLFNIFLNNLFKILEYYGIFSLRMNLRGIVV